MSNPHVKIVSSIDSTRLTSDVTKLLVDINRHENAQTSLTSSTGENLWDDGIGRMAELPLPEQCYSIINRALQDTYLSEIISTYSTYYRWRLLRLAPMTTYTVHRDSSRFEKNIRLHIPVITNDDSYLCFYDKKPSHGTTCTISTCHLNEGVVYEVDTSGWHTAVNYGCTARYHIVGVRYEAKRHLLTSDTFIGFR